MRVLKSFVVGMAVYALLLVLYSLVNLTFKGQWTLLEKDFWLAGIFASYNAGFCFCLYRP